MEPKLSIVMPVYNEGINLKIMLKILKTTIEIDHETLIVYDRPEDDSIPVVQELKNSDLTLRLIHNQWGRGVANAIKSGVNAARGKYILILAADDIGPVLAVDEMMSLMEEGCDFVSATRYAHNGRVFGGSMISRTLSRIANKLFHLFSGSSLTDSTIGIKMFRKNIFDKIEITSKPVGWVIAFELAMKAQLMRFHLGEVPIISINRFYGGKSSFKPGPWIVEYSKWFFWGIRQSLKSKHYLNRPQIKIPQRLIRDRYKITS